MDGISYAILFMFFEKEMYTTKVVATTLMPVNSQHPHQATHNNVLSAEAYKLCVRSYILRREQPRSTSSEVEK